MAQPLQQFEGKYEILAKIGEGGMGSVYKVRHRLLDEVRVIKVMRPQVENQEQVKDRFQREARIAVKLRHPNIAQMYDFSVDDSGTAYIVMEFVDGITLQTVLKKSGPPSLGLVLEITQQSLQALAHLHKKGIVHRDISPDNLMLGRDDMGEPRIKLIDLGIAKTVRGEHNLTATGVFLGKIRYASPEQFRPQDGHPIDHRSDLYSLGVVLYELLTGVHPIKGDSWSQLIAGHLFEAPLDFRHSDPAGKVPDQLRKVVMKALAKPVGDRFQDAQSFRSHITSLQRRFPWAEDDLAASLAGAGAPAVERPKAGSTQDRIIRQFGGGSTPPPLPTPTPAPAAVPTPPPVTPGGTPQLDAVLAAASHLVDLQMWAEARVQVGSVLKLAPDDARAGELMRRVEQGEAKAREVARAVSEIERLIDTGDLDHAGRQVQTALGRLAGATELEAVRERVDRLRRERHEAAMARLLQAAEAAAGDGRFAEAIASLEQALAMEPGHAAAARQLEAARIARAAQVEEERHARLVEQAVGEVERLIGEEHLDAARGRLDGALAELGRNERLLALDARLGRLEQQRRRARVAAAVERGQRLLAGSKPEPAVAAFEEALALDDGHPEAARGLAAARQAIAELAEREARERALAAAVDEVERLLVGGHLEEAAQRLDVHRRQLGEAPQLSGLGERIDEAKAARDRAERVATLIREAEAAAGADDPARAVERLERAAELDPSNGTVTTRLAAARKALAVQRTPAPTAADTTPLQRPQPAPVPAAAEHTMRIDVAAEMRAAAAEAAAAIPPEAPKPAPPKPAAAKPTKTGKAAAKGAKAAKPAAAPVAPAKVEKRTSSAVPAEAPSGRPAATPAAPTTARRLPRPVVVGIAAALLVVAVVVGVVLLRPGGEDRPPAPPAAGTLVIAATPWARVVSVTAADGAELAIPADAVTPLRLETAPGRYRVVLVGPRGGEPVSIDVDVLSGEVARAAAGLTGMDASEFLAGYGL